LSYASKQYHPNAGNHPLMNGVGLGRLLWDWN